MAINTSGLKPFQPGQSGNPGGKTGKRRKLEARFIEDLHDAWETNGRDAIDRLLRDKPEHVLKAVGSLLPKKVEHEHSVLDAERAERLLQLVDQRLAELTQSPDGGLADAQGAQSVN